RGGGGGGRGGRPHTPQWRVQPRRFGRPIHLGGGGGHGLRPGFRGGRRGGKRRRQRLDVQAALAGLAGRVGGRALVLLAAEETDHRSPMRWGSGVVRASAENGRSW